MAEQLVSADEAARILGLQVRTVRNYLREGRLPGVRIGKQYRIARADLEAFTAGLGGRDGAVAPQAAPPQLARAVAPVAEVSSIVELEPIEAGDAARLERTLAAASLAAAGREGTAPRVESIYDSQRKRLRLILVGPPAEMADLLRVVDVLTREPGSRGAV